MNSRAPVITNPHYKPTGKNINMIEDDLEKNWGKDTIIVNGSPLVILFPEEE